MAEHSTAGARAASGPRTYAMVFLVLALITAVEVALAQLPVVRSVRNAVFLALSLGKAGLVAGFYMHLRTDSRVYTYIFLSPAVLLLVFAYLLTIA
jgi:caa(3)-type oxidase subunit IV